MIVKVYGEGGYDPAKPNGNVVDEYDIPDPPADDVDPSIAAIVARNQHFVDASTVSAAALLDHVQSLTEQVSALLTGDTPPPPSA